MARQGRSLSAEEHWSSPDIRTVDPSNLRLGVFHSDQDHYHSLSELTACLDRPLQTFCSLSDALAIEKEDNFFILKHNYL
ncbi:hypothetical protein [Methylacidiphilum kamchatkense]|uniref:hypothetical protein n=1 Tax=Methylacidiphilum kamchatkense TaxID=431057 RepID=UPI000A78F145|nr:hypothetical protein [Methylacidiphilum kamchatkense]